MTITFDAATINVAGPPTLSFSHTLGAGSDPCILVGIEVTGGVAGDLVISSVTYNGVSLTKAVELVASTNNSASSIWYLVGGSVPSSGAHTVAVNGQAGAFTLKATALTFLGVTGSPEATGTFEASTGATNSIVSLTTLTDNAWVVDNLMASAGATPSVFAGQTQRSNNAASSKVEATSTKVSTTAGSYSMRWNAATTFTLTAHVAVALPAGGAAPVTRNCLFHSEF